MTFVHPAIRDTVRMLAVAAGAISASLGGSPAALADHRAIPTQPYRLDGLFWAGTYAAEHAQPRWYLESSWPGRKDQLTPHKAAMLRAATTWDDQLRQFDFNSRIAFELEYDVPWRKIKDAQSPEHQRYCEDPMHDDMAQPGYQHFNASIVFWTALARDRYGRMVGGRASNCYRVDPTTNQYRPWRFYMAINRKVRWYSTFGFSTDVPDDRVDLQSVATHEFGHAAGWVYHYDDQVQGQEWTLGTANCNPQSSGIETMCASTVKGSSAMRSLGSHDRATWGQAYPPR